MGECRASRRSARALDILDLADQAVTSAVTPITSKENVTREQWRVLTLLDASGDHDGSETRGRAMGEIAARAGVPNPTATRIVDRLVADGLAYRRSAPDDRRRVLVHISAAGHDLVDRVAATLDDTLGTVLADLDPADRLDILDVLHRLVDTASGSGGARPPRRPVAPADAATDAAT